jgi:hypothetical protein
MNLFLPTLPGRRTAIVFMLAATSASARAEWLIDVDAGALFDSNVNNGYEQRDIRADGALTLNGAGSYLALSGADSLTLGADARSEVYHRFHGLNVIGGGGTAVYRHKFGLGSEVPWIRLSAAVAADDYRSDIRDGDRIAFDAELGRRFNTAFDAAFGLTYERRYAKHDEPVVPGISGAVFDVRGQSIYARVGYAIDDRLLVGAELTLRRGDVVASTRPDLAIFRASEAIAADPTFGPDFFAYRLRGTTATVGLTASWALDDRSSLNVAYVDDRTDSAGSIVYRSHSANIVFAWRYY